MANPIQFDTFLPVRPDCLRCEDFLADAVDDLLTPEDKATFDQHIATCDQCAAAFTDALRGAAWLQVLKTPRPEPSAHLLDRILAQTSGAKSIGSESTPAFQPLLPPAFIQPAFSQPAFNQPAAAILEPIRPAANVLPFRPRAPYINRLPRIMFEPRLAMTAAMAFFSIALTMSLTGIKFHQLADLNPTSLRHTYYQTTAAVARRTESLRVVHVVEARVADLSDNVLDAAPRPQAHPDAEPQPAKPTQPKPADPNGVSRRAPLAPRSLPVSVSLLVHQNVQQKIAHPSGGLA